ncbi:MAG TPA: hypothetical protein DD473_28510 [Planctomycetaceae bacterium]|nr:hypothetical protein [Planctomycetaceae bacterium]
MVNQNVNQIPFVDTNGKLPPLWNRRVAFFANLLALFYGNEAQTEALRIEVGEIDSYSARLIPIMNLLFHDSHNLLVLERDPDISLCNYLKNDLGLSLPHLEVLPHQEYVEIGRQISNAQDLKPASWIDQIKKHNINWIDGYVTDETITGIAFHSGCQTIASTEASRDGNNKFKLHQFLIEAGLPAFETMLAESPLDIQNCAQELFRRGYRSAVVRAQIGASGIGMMRLKDLSNLETLPEIPSYFFFEGACLVQGWLEPGVKEIVKIRSPSTQLFLNDTTVYAYDMTEQILSNESIHQGNISPPPYMNDWPGLREETMRQAEQVGRWLHQTGYRGTASIDWLAIEYAGQKELEVIVCEINARVTGATYPSLVARHFLPNGAWLLRNLRLRTPITTEELLNLFDQPGHLFYPDRKAGIIPLNLNFGSDNRVHKGQFLCLAETPDACQKYLELAEKDLPVQWDSDRD